MPRPYILTVLRRSVIERAGSRCEYCLIHHDDTPDTHQIDHIIAIKHGGQTVSENLADA
ncbi:MAG TPA: HNH endonuclease signature motif containing protein [Blastocatellia bacterium]|nr:HNH endonuclease signature motif containing protein [Blastocatellia bacterium]